MLQLILEEFESFKKNSPHLKTPLKWRLYTVDIALHLPLLCLSDPTTERKSYPDPVTVCAIFG
jgi:hypothetical protein